MYSLFTLLFYIAFSTQSKFFTSSGNQEECLKFRRSLQTPKQSNNCQGFTANFHDGLNPEFTYDGPVTTANNNLQLKFSKGDTINPTTGVVQGYGGTASSVQPYLYGKFSARLKTARIGGIVTAFILMSNVKDEIDWEWVGKDEKASQTNYYSKGVKDYTKGKIIQNSFNTHSDFHDYSITWTSDSITWAIDNNVVRTVTKESTKAQNGTYYYPNTPSYIKLNVWDGGAGSKGTKDWAGGQVDFKDSEYLGNGGFISADVAWIKHECV